MFFCQFACAMRKTDSYNHRQEFRSQPNSNCQSKDKRVKYRVAKERINSKNSKCQKNNNINNQFSKFCQSILKFCGGFDKCCAFGYLTKFCIFPNLYNNAFASNKRRSAGRIVPCERSTISPIVTSSRGTSSFSPLRSTKAVLVIFFNKLSIVFSAVYSFQN